jgi:hypothetical protein
MVPPAMQATSMVKMCGWFNYDVTSHKKLDPNQTDNFNISLLAGFPVHLCISRKFNEDFHVLTEVLVLF